jgi:CRP/FNR family transcriptional regulator, polysaccharide utilization system transcription regulator
MANREQFSGCTINQRQCRCFEKLNESQLALVDAKSVIVRYKKGEIICKQGGLASHIMYVENGLAKVFLDNGVNSLVLKIIPPGNLLGLSSVSEDSNTFQYSAMAYLDSEIKQIDINLFRQLLSENPAFSREIIEILGSNSAQINGRFFCLTHKQSFGRLADILLCLSDRIFKNSEFELPLSRRDLAELSGLSAETVIRILKKFHDENLIFLDGKNFRIIDYQRLQKISETG